jgi:radical SAM superfamily enzyme YgiQ (UPF0313 family)
MRRRVLLISANRCTSPDPVFPLGLAYLSAALRQAGYECCWLDSLVHGDQLQDFLRNFAPDFVAISLRNVDDVLIRKKETFFGGLPALMTAIRREFSGKIILGGSAFSIFPQRLLEMSGAEFGIAGEGESGLLALLGALQNRTNYESIPGLAFRRDGEILCNPPTPEPFHWRLDPTDRPTALTDYDLRSGSMLNVQTQRGCPHRCCYCTYPLIEGRRHRFKPADMVAADFEQLQRLGAKYVFIVDSVFNSSPRHVEEICQQLARQKNKVRWGCFLRPEGLTPELMRLMSQAGLAHIEFGSDSFCDEVLAAYQKDFIFADILYSSELARRERIDFCHFLIAGGPGETPATLEQSFQNSLRLEGAVIMAVVGMRVYPGTSLQERATTEKRLGVDTDLLQPAYYLAPGLTEEEVFKQLNEFSRRSPNWITGDPDPAYEKMVTRLRQRGVAGPLWSYFSLIQQLHPTELAGGSSQVRKLPGA